MGHYFMMLPEVAEEFFRLCLEREAVTEKERVEILQELEGKGKLLGRGSTGLNQDDFAREVSKVARVLNIKREGK